MLHIYDKSKEILYTECTGYFNASDVGYFNNIMRVTNTFSNYSKCGEVNVRNGFIICVQWVRYCIKRRKEIIQQ